MVLHLHVQDLRLYHLLAAEGQKLMRERAGTLGCHDDLLYMLQPGLPAQDIRREETGVAEDHLEKVIEVVRDPACQASYGVELLRLPELLLGRFLA